MKSLFASHRIGDVLGFEVRILYALYIFVAMMLVMRLPGAPNLSVGALILLSTILWPIFILLHELGHCLAAYKEAVPVQHILLHPLGGFAFLGGTIPGPMAEIMISLAGPFVSLMLGALSALPLFLFWGQNPMTPTSPLGVFFYYCFYTNLIITLFNFLPVFPMDGGRVAMALAVMRVGPERALQMIGTISKVGLLLLGLAGVILLIQGQPGFGLIGLAVLLYVMGGQERQARSHVVAYASHTGPVMPGGAMNEAEPWAMPAWNPDTGFAPKGETQKASGGWFQRWRTAREAGRQDAREQQREDLNRSVDTILAKVKEQGVDSLSPEERDTLNRASREYRE